MVAAFKFMAFDGFYNGLAVFKAHLHFLLELPSNFKKRRTTKQLFKPVKIKSIYEGSLVWDYYIKGVRKYSELKVNNTK